MMRRKPPSATPAGIADCDAGVGNNYAANSTLEANLNLLAAALAANVSAAPSSYAVATVGTAPDQVYVLAVCPCSACVAAAFVDGKKICPGINGVTVYEEACVVRFSGQRFMDFLRADQWQVTEMIWSPDQASASVKVTAVGWFNAAITKILTALVDHAVAATGNSTTKKYFVTGEEDFDPKIYGFAQCVPDLMTEQCNECLRTLLDDASALLATTADSETPVVTPELGAVST
ncbi:hypothetical protein E2562_003835 [Oryza meyeriana var. granulata]|uniref:Gnk2-homologous domain-containing protein n=1 Tax=Oryza meyeriana var. granulata TaxID=110450 RepID=A0A6G1CYN8_9ORYZ|nr:hypothetical protein E2562_003835 [Oryza meyeriana var. granulata]